MGRKAHEIFESATCWKCGGSGRIITFSHVLGGVCFACDGIGHKLTTRGAKDYQAWRDAVDAVTMRPFADLKPGMFAKIPGQSFPRYYPVEAISGPVTSSVGHAVKDESTGTWQVDEAGNTVFVHDSVYIVRFARPVVSWGPLGKSETLEYEVKPDSMVQIHAGDAMPKADDFDTRKKAEVA